MAYEPSTFDTVCISWWVNACVWIHVWPRASVCHFLTVCVCCSLLLRFCRLMAAGHGGEGLHRRVLLCGIKLFGHPPFTSKVCVECVCMCVNWRMRGLLILLDHYYTRKPKRAIWFLFLLAMMNVCHQRASLPACSLFQRHLGIRAILN